MTTTYEFVAGDTGSKLVVTCKHNATRSAIDLTGSTVQLLWNVANGTLVTRNMTVTTPASGVAEYQFAAGELYDPTMSFMVRITDGLGKVISSVNPIVVPVRKAYG